MSAVGLDDRAADRQAQAQAPGPPAGRVLATESAADAWAVAGVPEGADLDYDEDVIADVDMNVVMTSEGRFIEVQGTGEHAAFDREELDALLALATGGIRELDALQAAVLAASE